MSSVNHMIQSIHDEFMALSSLTKPYNAALQETDRILQLEFVGLDSEEVLYELNSIQYFDVYCGSDTLKLTIQKYENQYSDLSMEHIKEQRFRIKYNKNADKDYVKGLNYYFFIEEKAVDFLSSFRFTPNEKVVIGIYNIEAFSTPVFQFVDLSTNDHQSHEREINTDFITKIERMSKNSNNKIDHHKCVLAYTIEEINTGCSFQEKIKRLYYKSFFETISYKYTEYNYDIRGKKNITIFQDENFSVENYLAFVELIDFLYKDDKFLEKFIIIKNVITRYIQDRASFSDLDKKILEISKTARHYFETYIQNELDDFFKNRDTVYKEALNTSKAINEQSDKINTYINASLISFLILVMTFIFNNFEVFNPKNLFLAWIGFMIFSFTFYGFVYKSSNERFETIKEQFDLFLDKMGIILLSEKEEIISAYLNKPYDDLQKSLKRIGDLCITINILLIISIAVNLIIKAVTQS